MTSPKPSPRYSAPRKSRSPKRPPLSMLQVLTRSLLGVVFLYLLFSQVPKRSKKEQRFALQYSKGCPSLGTEGLRYAIVMDAGSTGSRIHIYRFSTCPASTSNQLSGPPVLEDEVFEQLKPGLSSYENEPEKAAHSLEPLMLTALKSVPEPFRAKTPISLKATAGLRLLGQGHGDKILEKVRQYLATFPFNLHDPKKSVEIMDGKDEGVFAWITVNYLLGYLDPSKGKKTAAIMDLGGGSTQIVFEPFNDIPDGSHKVQVPFGNKTYTLYQKSYDGFGLMQGRKKSQEKGGCASKTHSTCLDLLGSLFDKHDTCHLAPCSFAGAYMPPLEEHFYDGEIYAFSYFYDVYAEPYGKVKGGFKVGHVYEAVKVSCANDPEHHECLDLGFIYSLLKVGYDLPKSRHLLTAKKINGIETGWALGAALALLNEKPTP